MRSDNGNKYLISLDNNVLVLADLRRLSHAALHLAFMTAGILGRPYLLLLFVQ